MCGINGFIDFNNYMSEQDKYKQIKKMNDKIIHRGPDDFGQTIINEVVLGMRRLSIVDLATGEQPMYSFDNKQVIVFNGEIYNFKEVRKNLINNTYTFKTTSDTEVILNAYKEYGNKFANHFKGMFSIVIYDLELKKLIIVRDRAGEKPLYYFMDNDIFIFSSEIKSLLSINKIKKNINKTALNQFLQLTYIPSPLTIFEGIYKLKAGHIMEIDLQGKVKNSQYWSMNFDDNNQINSKKECVSLLRQRVFESVEKTLYADVPVGVLMSGGIDSTIIAGVAAKISKKQINTFTIGFNQKKYDERKLSQYAANKFDSIHHSYVLDYNLILPEMEQIISNIDEPFADSSYIASYMVSKYAKNFVKVVLTGDAADELFGGYDKYLIDYYSTRYNKIPKKIRKLIEKIVYLFNDTSILSRKLRKVIQNSSIDVFNQRKNMMCLGFNDIELEKLVKIDFQSHDHLDFINDVYNSQNQTNDELNKALYTDFKIVLEGDMLVKMDRSSMLSSLEARVPFLDKDIIELSSRIPSKYKINKINKKIILKEAFKDIIPRKHLKAQKKGFGVPISHWMKKELKEDLIKVLDKEKIESQKIFNYSYVSVILEEHFSNKKNRGSQLWTLYIFQKWYDNFFKQN
jgi:asparagine synthase (glutamine-hydrolysing)